MNTTRNEQEKSKLSDEEFKKLISEVEYRVKYWQDRLREAEEQLNHHTQLLKDLNNYEQKRLDD